MSDRLAGLTVGGVVAACLLVEPEVYPVVPVAAAARDRLARVEILS
jgi:hypothetical protein